MVNAAADVERNKRVLIKAAKAIVKIAADELGITAGLECLTTGNLAACGETALNVASAFAGGVAGKLLVKYGAPWKWAKAAALARRLYGLADEALGAVKGWFKARKTLAAAEAGLERAAASCNSFAPGTRVQLADGSTVPIDKIKVGQEVLAHDEKTGRTSARRVVATIIGHGTKHLVEVTVDVDGSKTGTVTATAGHPFWLPQRHEWVDAGDLRVGDWLRTSAGTWVQVSAVKAWTAQRTVHNLTVDTDHTYFVAAGNDRVLVHNSSCPLNREAKVVDQTLGAGSHAREGLSVERGDRIDPATEQPIIDEMGSANGCHTCGASEPGTKSGHWIGDHQPANKLVLDGPFTAYPHRNTCRRIQGGVVNGLNREWYNFE